MINLTRDEFLEKIRTSSLWFITQMEHPFEVVLGVKPVEEYASPRLDSMTESEARMFIDIIWDLASGEEKDELRARP